MFTLKNKYNCHVEFVEFFPFQISFPGGMYFFPNPGLHTNKISSEDVENGLDLELELFLV